MAAVLEGEEEGPFSPAKVAGRGQSHAGEEDEEDDVSAKVTGEDGVVYENDQDAEAGTKIKATCPLIVSSREVKEKKNRVVAFSTPGLKDVHLWIDIFGFTVLDAAGKVLRSVSYPMLASWMIDNDLFKVQLVNKKGEPEHGNE